MKNISLICDENYIHWVKPLIINNKKNFFHIFCTNEYVYDELFLLNYKNYKLHKINKKKYKLNIKNQIDKIEKILKISFFEIKKSFYAYDEILLSNSLQKYELNSGILDEYICSIFKFFETFFKKNKINCFFLEQESGIISAIIKKLCKLNKIKCVIFYEVYFNDEFLLLDANTLKPYPNKIKNIKTKIDKSFNNLKYDPISKGEKLWQEQNKKKYTIIKRLNYRNKNYNNFLYLNFFEKLKYKFIKILTKIYFNFNSSNFIPKSYAIFYLSYQPEATTYGYGSPTTDLSFLINKIRMSLPQNMSLLIKEHPEQLKKIPRSLSFYKKIKRLKNTYLISDNLNNKKLLQKSKLIFTISGTISLEAAIVEKKVIVFSRLTYNLFKKNIYLCNNFNYLNDLIRISLKKKSKTVNHKDFKNLRKFFFKGQLYFRNQQNITAYKSIQKFIDNQI